MTTQITTRAEAGGLTALLKQRPGPLPPAVLHSEQIPGYRNAQWVARPIDESERQSIVATLEEIEQRMQPGRREWIIGIMTRLAAHYPGKATDSDSFAVVLSDMADDLAEFSHAHLIMACAEWRKTQQFWPKTSELREMLIHIQCMDRVYRRRCKVLLGVLPAMTHELPRQADDGVLVDLKPVLESLARSKRVG